eukprot:TRINITY_DN3181_c1_g1_i2.p4 TRINITY_DN3181_c1_g1~~TRINITY_DN3181_c1_g1_i2.p4  ORF type:complete len:144 (+),score=59.43 TRINITY_DN3181_c1_g1_i2:94-525(+)
MLERVGPAAAERASSYERLLRESSDEHNAVALALLVGEARNRELRLCTGAERVKVEAKWRHIKARLKEARQYGMTAGRLRADLASKYPFMGMVSEGALLHLEQNRLAIVTSKNSQLLHPQSQSSASSQSFPDVTSSTDEEEGV